MQCFGKAYNIIGPTVINIFLFLFILLDGQASCGLCPNIPLPFPRFLPAVKIAMTHPAVALEFPGLPDFPFRKAGIGKCQLRKGKITVVCCKIFYQILFCLLSKIGLNIKRTVLQ